MYDYYTLITNEPAKIGQTDYTFLRDLGQESKMNTKRLVFTLLGFIIIQRLLELRLAARNRAWALSAGAQEVGAGHYPLFFLLHTGWLAGWTGEALVRGPSLSPRWPLWLVLLGVAQGLRYWAIFSLGRRWNTRILVIPGEPPLRRGPYRWLKHPNYLAVALELATIPLIFGAWLTALVAGLLNALLLLGIRIPAEEKALRGYSGLELDRDSILPLPLETDKK